jgi:hypothetical protein
MNFPFSLLVLVLLVCFAETASCFSFPFLFIPRVYVYIKLLKHEQIIRKLLLKLMVLMNSGHGSKHKFICNLISKTETLCRNEKLSSVKALKTETDVFDENI